MSLAFLSALGLCFSPARAVAAGAARVGILRSHAMAERVPAEWGGAILGREVDLWAGEMARARVPYRVFGDVELRKGESRYETVVLPFPDYRDPQLAANLRSLVEGARRVLLIGASFQEGQVDTFFSDLSKTCELRVPRLLTKKEGRFVALNGRSFVSAGGEGARPGFRMEVEAGVPMFVSKRRPTAPDIDGLVQGGLEGHAWYVQWGLRPYLPESGYDENQAILSARCGGTEFLWIGFPPSALASPAKARGQNRAFLDSVSAWLAGAPTLSKAFWKDDRELAVVVTCDVEARFETAADMLRVLRREHVRGSFFLLGQEAEKHPKLVAELAAQGEIGSHSMFHEDFSKKTPAEQRKETEDVAALLKEMGVERLVGFRPPYEGYNDETVGIQAEAGMRFIYGLLDYDYSYPHPWGSGEPPFYRFPRIVRDDYNIVVEMGGGDPLKDYLPVFVEDLDMIERLGGIYPFSIHTNFMLLPEQVAALDVFFREAKRRPAWFTTFGEIIDWMHERDAVEISRTKEGFRVVNHGSKPLIGFPLVAYRLALNPRHLPAALARKIAVFDRGDGGQTLSLHLEPGQALQIPGPAK